MFAITHENNVENVHFNMNDVEKVFYNGVLVWEKNKARYILKYNVVAGEPVQLMYADSGFVSSNIKQMKIDGQSVSFTKDYTFDTDGEHTVELFVDPAVVGIIPANAFRGITTLTYANVQSGVTKIGNYAFNGCTNLVEVYVPNTITEIGEYVFQNCTALTTLDVM